MLYWPAGAMAAALIAVVFSAGWFSRSLKQLKAVLARVGENRKALDEARAGAKDLMAKAKARRVEMQSLHEAATKLFWKNEKTWLG